MLVADALLFWTLTLLTLGSGVLVVTCANPIFSALALAMTMVGVAALFVTLDAFFLAGVQLIVYAGAVMVLFVMVLMLFDLKNEIRSFSRGAIAGTVKLGVVGLFAGLIAGTVLMTKTAAIDGGTALVDANSTAGNAAVTGATTADSTSLLGHLLFSQYLFGFEALGVLLLVVAVGSVALARSKGGTHARS